MDNMWILAQAEAQEGASQVTSEPVTEQEAATTAPADANATVPSRPQQSQYSYLVLLVFMFVAIYLLFFGGARKQKQQRKKLVQSLEKNDRVQTIGGILGTIVDIRDEEIVLKIDESNNTKIHVLPSAIGRNLTKEGK
jgi:preprotein translocase subunit YajC